jgi:hypothetical protein
MSAQVIIAQDVPMDDRSQPIDSTMMISIIRSQRLNEGVTVAYSLSVEVLAQRDRE